MLSIYQNFYSIIDNNEVNTKTPKVILTLQAAQFILKNAKLTIDAFNKGKLSQLDPIVGENSCHLRGLAVILASQDLDFQNELVSLKNNIQKLSKRLDACINNPPLLNSEATSKDILNSLGLSLEISTRAHYFFLAHLLTLGKNFYVGEDGREVSNIEIYQLRDKLSRKLDTRVIQKIVELSREQIAFESVEFIQEEASKLDGEEHLQKQLSDKCCKYINPTLENKIFNFKVSCAFYNFKATLCRLTQENIPILIKEHVVGKKVPRGIFLSSLKENVPFDVRIKNRPVYVLECFFPKNSSRDDLLKAIPEYGLMDIALANVALVPQFSKEDDISHLDEKAREEIKAYRERGKQLKCQTVDPEIFSIMHTYASSIQEERARCSI